MSTALTKPERSVLAECEAVIKRGMESFVEVGNALLRIREGRLYKDAYSSFENYCSDKWGFKRGNAHDLIETARVAGIVQDIEQPKNREVIRPLTSLPITQQREAWKEAIATAKEPGKPTAKEVKLVVERVTNQTSRVSSPATPAQDSELLSMLKSYWTAANRTERAQFLSWIKQ